MPLLRSLPSLFSLYLHKGSTISRLLKLLLFLLFAYILYRQIAQANLAELWAATALAWRYSDILLLLLLLGLMPLNWFLETLHWRSVLRPVYRPSTGTALRAVLSALSISLCMPNRVGESLGRLRAIPEGYRGEAFAAGLCATAGRWLILFCGGLLALVFGSLPWRLPLVSLFLIPLIFGAYLLLPRSLLALSKRAPLRFLGLRALPEELATYYSPARLLGLLPFALLRYLVYSLQYLLILYLLAYQGSLAYTLSAVALLFFIQTGLPVPLGLGLPLRGQLALFLFFLESEGNATGQSLVLLATFVLWFLNLAVPASFGLFFCFNMRKSEKTA